MLRAIKEEKGKNIVNNMNEILPDGSFPNISYIK